MNAQEQTHSSKDRMGDRGNPQVPMGGGRQGRPQSKTIDRYIREITDKSFTDQIIMKFAKELSEKIVKTQRPPMKPEIREESQLLAGRLYNHLRISTKKLMSDEIELDALKISLRTMQAQIAFATARRIVSEDFKIFFDVSLDKIFSVSEDDSFKTALNEFTIFFQSFYAYYFYHLELEKGKQGVKK